MVLTKPPPYDPAWVMLTGTMAEDDLYCLDEVPSPPEQKAWRNTYVEPELDLRSPTVREDHVDQGIDFDSQLKLKEEAIYTKSQGQTQTDHSVSTHKKLELLQLWHRRLGHAAYPKVRKYLKENLQIHIPSHINPSPYSCDGCAQAKSKAKTKPKTSSRAPHSRATSVGERIFADTSVVSRESLGRARYPSRTLPSVRQIK